MNFFLKFYFIVSGSKLFFEESNFSYVTFTQLLFYSTACIKKKHSQHQNIIYARNITLRKFTRLHVQTNKNSSNQEQPKFSNLEEKPKKPKIMLRIIINYF